MSARECRVRVRRSPRDLEAPTPWVAVLVPVDDEAAAIPAGRTDTMLDAVLLGVSAARFVAAGLPWRAPDDAEATA